MLNYPKSFKDTAGQEWSMDIPLSTYLRLKNSTLKLNIEDLIFVPKTKEDMPNATRPLADLVDDLERFISVIFEIIRPDAERLNVTFQDFTKVLDGAAMMAMTDAFCQGCYDFFRCPRKRLILEDAVTKGKAMVQTMETRAATEIPRTTEMMVQTVNQEFDRQLKNLASVSPASPE